MHGKGVDELFEKVSFQTAFEGVESLILRGSIFQTVGANALTDLLPYSAENRGTLRKN